MSAKVLALTIRVVANSPAAWLPSALRSTTKHTRRKRFAASKPIEHRDGELRFAGAGRHGQQHRRGARFASSVFDLLDGALLIGAQRKPEIEGPRPSDPPAQLPHRFPACPAGRPASASRRERGGDWLASAHRETRSRSRFRPASDRAGRSQKKQTARGSCVLRRLDPRAADRLGSALEPEPTRVALRLVDVKTTHSCFAALPRPRRCIASRRTAHSPPDRFLSAIRQSPCCVLSQAGRRRCSAALAYRLPSRAREDARRSASGSKLRRYRSPPPHPRPG